MALVAPLVGITRGAVDYGSFRLDIPHLELHHGVYWVTGPNGSGKTTLFRALLELEPLTEGNLQSATGLTRGYLPQNFRDALFPWLTAEDNLFLFGGDREFLLAWARCLGLQDRELKQRTYHLSGGQAQRLALVREAELRPTILLLDEPFSALDTTAGEAAGKLISETSREAPGIIIFTNHGHIPNALNKERIRRIDIVRVSDERSEVSIT